MTGRRGFARCRNYEMSGDCRSARLRSGDDSRPQRSRAEPDGGQPQSTYCGRYPSAIDPLDRPAVRDGNTMYPPNEA